MVSEPIPLVLVDGFNLLWRAAYGFPARITAPDGRDVTAMFGFLALLRKAHRELGQPTECVVVFDGEDGWQGRQASHPGYKEHRRELDFSPIAWLPAIQQALSDNGLVWHESRGWEADDVIATLAAGAGEREVVVMSTDRDYHQLLGPTVVQLNTTRAVDRRVITELEVRDRHGVAPDQWCDYIALVGDRSDAIPGISGIGPIRARRLLAGGRHLDDLPGSGLLAGAHGRRLAAEFGQALDWRALVTLRTDLELDISPTGVATEELPLAATILHDQGIW